MDAQTTVSKLRAPRGEGENYSDVIVRLARKNILG
jgi:hypothetical protein